MDPQSKESAETRPLTGEERKLTEWMLLHGTDEARSFLEQLSRAEATLWRCPCGCASFNLKVEGYPPAPPGVEVLADFTFSQEGETKGIFVYQSGGILSGVEVVGYEGDAPTQLPDLDQLKSLPNSQS